MNVYWPRQAQIKEKAREMLGTLECTDLTDKVYELVDTLRENFYGAPRINAAACIYIAAKECGGEITYSEFKRRFRLSHGAVAGMVEYLCKRNDKIKELRKNPQENDGIEKSTTKS